MAEPTEELPIEEVEPGFQVADPGSGVFVLVKGKRPEGERVVLEVGLPFCFELRLSRGTVMNVRRPKRRRGKAKARK